MNLTIVAPSGILCQTKVEKITLPGTVGEFMVLPGHAPLIASLTVGKIIYTENGKETSIAIKNGIIKVEKDQVEVCVETITSTKN